MTEDRMMSLYRAWRDDGFFDAETRRELLNLTEDEIYSRFSGHLEFGTGGLRGVMGAGIRRMNRYTVGQATLGLGRYLLSAQGGDACRARGVVIGYDTRMNSQRYAEAAAQVLSGLGIGVFLLEEARPTPELSFAIRRMNCLAGVVITASHNPPEYNGYKVYDEHGCQMTPGQIRPIQACIRSISDVREVSFEGDPELIRRISLTDEYVAAVLHQSMLADQKAKAALKAVYTPLHGTGLIPVTKALEADGFEQIALVSEQTAADGRFSTVPTPNPEEPRSLKAAICLAEQTDADIAAGTDPDADRVGIAVRTGQGYWIPTGNQMGALLTDFVLRQTDLAAVGRAAILNTVVSSQTGAQIAASHGVTVLSTLTGFKYIGEKITEFEQARRAGCTERDYRFLMGYEESCGYLTGEHVRDKDGVVAVMLFMEAAAYWKAQGMTLWDRMEAISRQFGYEETVQISVGLTGPGGAEKVETLLEAFKRNEFIEMYLGERPVQCVDYRQPVEISPAFGNLPTAELVRLAFLDGSWAAIRPSGTEAKLKIYLAARGCSREAAVKRLAQLRQGMTDAVQAAGGRGNQ